MYVYIYIYIYIHIYHVQRTSSQLRCGTSTIFSIMVEGPETVQTRLFQVWVARATRRTAIGRTLNLQSCACAMATSCPVFNRFLNCSYNIYKFYIYVHLCVYMYIYMYGHTYKCIHMYTYIHACICTGLADLVILAKRSLFANKYMKVSVITPLFIDRVRSMRMGFVIPRSCSAAGPRYILKCS